MDIEKVREYAEEYPIEIKRHAESDRIVISVDNEGRYNGTDVDLIDLLAYLVFHFDEYKESVLEQLIIDIQSGVYGDPTIKELTIVGELHNLVEWT